MSRKDREVGEASPVEESSPGAAPRLEYERRLEDRRARGRRARRREERVANARLVVFVAAAVMLWLSLGAKLMSALWLILPAIVFIVLIVVHDRLMKAGTQADREAAFYEDGLARIDGEWMGKGVSGEHFADPDHVFAMDLDLFGEGSMFERLCRARTRAGEEALSDWLLKPAPPSTVLERQAAVEELRERLDLREDIAVLGEDVRASIEPVVLREWAGEPRVLKGAVLPTFSALLSLLSIFTLVGWIALGLGPIPFIAAVSLQWIFGQTVRKSVAAVVGTVERPGRELSVLAEVLRRLEQESFESPYLKRLREALDADDEPASVRVASLGRLVDLLSARSNQFFLPIAFLLGWSLHLSFAIERWRARFGPRVGGWLEALGKLEALSSLSAYAYECPDDPFPEVLEDGALFEGESLAHPLLRDAVPNDVRLGGGHPRVLLVSGSNMSGKSTLLRTVGVNAVLALAGAPVRARSLRLSALSLGATLRVLDSLQEGASRFYAEIKRLKQITDATKRETPVLFLLDEILHGTNSHDRSIGARAVVRGLIESGAIGLLTTHDLALANMADEEEADIANVHFEDHMEDGEIRFDYVMRPGVVRKSNAIALMRAVGLEV